jgi:hypothetical protein
MPDSASAMDARSMSQALRSTVTACRDWPSPNAAAAGMAPRLVTCEEYRGVSS